jgi:hypothetical protein
MPCCKSINGLGLTTLAKTLIDFVRFLDAVTNRFQLISAIRANHTKHLNLWSVLSGRIKDL